MASQNAARLLLMLLFTAFVGGAQAQTVFHVSPSGSDGGDGSARAPFATLARARDAVRKRRETAPQGSVTVRVRGGTYFLDKPLLLGAADGGAPEASVVYEAAPGETPVLSGGIRVTGWRRNGQLWQAVVPGVKEGRTPPFRSLWVNGERRFRARTPNQGAKPSEGFLQIAEPGVVTGTHRLEKPAVSFGFKPGDLKSGNHGPDAEIVVLHYWLSTHLPLEKIDEATHTVSLRQGSRTRLTEDHRRIGARYFLENSAQALDAPGEWYLDRATGVLSYLPLPGEDIAAAEVIAPRLPQILRLEGRFQTRPGNPNAPPERTAVQTPVSDIVFRGLTFSHTDWAFPEGATDVRQGAEMVSGALQIAGAKAVAFSHCRIAHTGGYGVEIGQGSQDVRVLACDITDTGAGGIKIGDGRAGSVPLLQTGEVQVENCRVSRFGRLFPAGIGVLLTHAFGSTVAHNHIHDGFYSGVSVGWVWNYTPSISRDNRIENNHIHDIGQGVISDMAGVYTLGISPGTVVRGNIVHGVRAAGYGAWGLYTDQASSGIVLENNLVYDVGNEAFHQHWGENNLVRNNILFGGQGNAAVRQSNAKPGAGQFRFERNIVVARGGPIYTGGYAHDIRKPSFNADGNLLVVSGPVAGNTQRPSAAVEVTANMEGALSWAEWQALGRDAASFVAADAGFADVAKGDYRLRPDSPASKIGFTPWDVGQAGVQKGVTPGPEGRPAPAKKAKKDK